MALNNLCYQAQFKIIIRFNFIININIKQWDVKHQWKLPIFPIKIMQKEQRHLN